jgi:hypothetical protein
MSKGINIALINLARFLRDLFKTYTCIGKVIIENIRAIFLVFSMVIFLLIAINDIDKII